MVENSIHTATLSSKGAPIVHHPKRSFGETTEKGYKVEPLEFTWNRPEAEFQNAIDYILHDHAWYRSLLLKSHDCTMDEKKRICRILVKETMQHSELEEQLLWPFLKHKLGDEGERIRERILSDEQKLRELLQDMEHHFDDSFALEKSLRIFEAELVESMEEEETVTLPTLAKICSAEELREAEESMIKSRPYEPSHPHTWAPQKDLGIGFNKLNQIVGMVDSVRDALSGNQ